MKIVLNSLTLLSFQTCMTFLILWNTEKDILIFEGCCFVFVNTLSGVQCCFIWTKHSSKYLFCFLSAIVLHNNNNAQYTEALLFNSCLVHIFYVLSRERFPIRNTAIVSAFALAIFKSYVNKLCFCK